MELRHLRYFIGIIENEGYREASRVLHVAQPALSQTVIDLEEEIGTPLLVRGPKKITLTPAGKAFFKEAKNAVRQAERAVNAARRAAKEVHGSLSIGFIPGTAQHFLPELLKTFKETHPQAEVNVHGLIPSAQLEMLEKGDLDVALTRDFVRRQESHLSSRPIFQVPLMAVLPETRATENGSLTIASLAAEPLVLLERNEAPALFDSILNLCQDEGFIPKMISQTPLAETIVTLVKAGEGIAIVPMCAHVFVCDGLKRARIHPDSVQVNMVAAWATASPSIVLREFLSFLTEQIPRIQESTLQHVVKETVL